LIIGQAIVQLVYNNWACPIKVTKSLETNIFEMEAIGFRGIKKLLTR